MLKLDDIQSHSCNHMVHHGFAASWSENNEVAMMTEKGVQILELRPSPHNRASTIECVRNALACSLATPTSHVGIDTTALLHLSEASEACALILNPDWAPTLDKTTPLIKVPIQMMWSPRGVLNYGKCLLACVTNTGQLTLYGSELGRWKEKVDISRMWLRYWASMFSRPTTNFKFLISQLQYRTSRVKITAIAWERQSGDEFSCSTLLITGSKDGIIGLWLIEDENHTSELSSQPCLSTSTQNGVRVKLMRIFMSHLSYITSMLWCNIDEKCGVLIVGSLKGTINSIKVSICEGPEKLGENARRKSLLEAEDLGEGVDERCGSEVAEIAGNGSENGVAVSKDRQNVNSGTETGHASRKECNLTSDAEPSLSSVAEPNLISDAEPKRASGAESNLSFTAEPSQSSAAEPNPISDAEPKQASGAESNLSSAVEPSQSSAAEPNLTSVAECDLNPEDKPYLTSEAQCNQSSEAECNQTSEAERDLNSEDKSNLTSEAQCNQLSKAEHNQTSEAECNRTSEAEHNPNSEYKPNLTSEAECNQTSEAKCNQTSEAECNQTSEAECNQTSEAEPKLIFAAEPNLQSATDNNLKFGTEPDSTSKTQPILSNSGSEPDSTSGSLTSSATNAEPNLNYGTDKEPNLNVGTVEEPNLNSRPESILSSRTVSDSLNAGKGPNPACLSQVDLNVSAKSRGDEATREGGDIIIEPLWPEEDQLAVESLTCWDADSENVCAVCIKGRHIIVLILRKCNGKLESKHCHNTRKHNLTGLIRLNKAAFLIGAQQGGIFKLTLVQEADGEVTFLNETVKAGFIRSRFGVMGLAASRNRALIAVNASIMGAYDNSNLKDLSTFYICSFDSTEVDPIALITSKTCASVDSVWDCLELARLNILQKKIMYLVPATIREELDTMDLSPLIVTMWLTHFVLHTLRMEQIENGATADTQIKAATMSDLLAETRLLVFSSGVFQRCSNLLCQSPPPSQFQLLSLALMRQWLVSLESLSSMHATTKLTASSILEQIDARQLPLPEKEFCAVCGDDVPKLTGFSTSECIQGHVVDRCSLSLVQIPVECIAVHCQRCGVCAHPLAVSGNFAMCVFCNDQLVLDANQMSKDEIEADRLDVKEEREDEEEEKERKRRHEEAKRKKNKKKKIRLE